MKTQVQRCDYCDEVTECCPVIDCWGHVRAWQCDVCCDDAIIENE